MSMVEVLVWHGVNYMDNWNLTKINNLDSKELLKYNARPQPGDIVEAHEEGFWGKRKGFGKEKGFSLIKILGYELKDIEQYVNEQEYEIVDLKMEIKYKFRYRINLDRIGLTEPGEILIDGPTFINALEDKRNG